MQLNSPPDENVRPTTDRVKEALFGSIQFSVPGATVLDLFAGSGALGLEAISRGATKAFFVEHDKDALKTIEKNISKCGFSSSSEVIKKDYENALKYFENKQKFDIVFIDPPYNSGYYDNVVLLLKKYNLIDNETILVLESSNVLQLDANWVYIYNRKKYGITHLSYARLEG